MIYVDTSVALAHLLSEDRTPADELWNETLIASRLVEYETWTRINAKGLTKSHGTAVQQILGRIALLELAAPVLVRALDPFPVPVRTLDALHLASIDFLRAQGHRVLLASYDERMLAAARKMQIPVSDFVS